MHVCMVQYYPGSWNYVTLSLFDNTRKSSSCAYLAMESRLQFNITFVSHNIKVANIDQTKLLSTAVENFELYDSCLRDLL